MHLLHKHQYHIIPNNQHVALATLLVQHYCIVPNASAMPRWRAKGAVLKSRLSERQRQIWVASA